MAYQIQTKCVCSNSKGSTDSSGAVSFPIYQSATFSHPGVGESTGYDYSRLQNPTREQLENQIAALEGGYDAVALSSGMAAIGLLMELFKPGDHLVVSDDLYGGSIRLFRHVSAKNGISFDFLDTSDVETIKSHIKPNTKAIFIETPSNPMMIVTDLKKVASVAKENGLLLIVDNTFLTPYFQRPMELGADIVIHSGTKFIGGHNDTLAGFLVVAREELSEQVRFLLKTTGASLAPFDSWLIMRGLKTLALRMERQQENAMAIAKWLSEHPKVKKVYYIGLEDHPGYAVNKEQASGFGSMISFHVESEEVAKNVLRNVKLIHYAESLGGVDSLITYPMLQTHADVPEEERERKGINNTLLRLSVGVEHKDDLIGDLKSGLV